MVNISIDVTDLGGEARPGDKVVLWKPAAAGSATHAGRVISTAPVDVFLTNGKATVPDVEPGSMRVLLQCRGVESQGPIDVTVPDGTGTVTLRSLIEAQFEYAPPIVSAVQEAASNASASEEAAIRAQIRSEAAADRADAKVDDAINNGANLIRDEVKQDADRAVSARQAATQSESNAKASEDAAASSESNAKTSETNAKQSETNAGDYAAVATTAATEAVDAMEVASEAASSIGDSASQAAASASSAAQSETNAAQYESSAATHAQNAIEAADLIGTAEQVGTWAQQAQDAANRVGTAEQVDTWAQQAATSAANASTSEGNAAQSESNAANHARDSLSSAERAEGASDEASQAASDALGMYDNLSDLLEGQVELSDASIHWTLSNDDTASKKLLGEISHRNIATHNAGAGRDSFNSRELVVGEPYLYDDQTIITDDEERIVDGAQFFTMIRVGDRPGEWLDEYYGYVSGHGYGFTTNEAKRTVTWLVTAPSPYGPWTWREPVMGTRLGETTSRSYVVGPGCLAPDVMWVGDEIWLNYHGGKLTQPWVEDYDYANRWGAPSALAKSTDGINFVEDGIAIDIDRGVNDLSPYRASASYRRTVRANGVWHTVWQGNTTNFNEQMGTGTAGYSVGHAISHDGVDWKKQPPLLWPEAKGDQGPFSPSITKINSGWLLVTTYRRQSGGEQVGLPRMYFAEELKPGAFRSLGDLHLPDRPGGRDQRQVQSPFFFHHDGVLHMAYGNTPRAGAGVGIQLAKIGFR